MSCLGWAATRAFRVGDLHVGVRVSTSEIDRALVSALADVSVEDPGVPPNYSIIEDTTDHGRGQRYRVFIGCKHATTTRTLARAIAILCGFLEDHLPGPVQDGQLDLLAVTLIHGQEAVLAPWQLRFGAPTMEARLERYGIHVLEHRSALTDAEEKQVVVHPWRLPQSTRTGEGSLRMGAARRTAPGRFRLRGWLLWKSWRWQEITPGIAAAYGMTVAREPDAPEKSLDAMASLVAGLPIVAINSEREVAAHVRGLWT